MVNVVVKETIQSPISGGVKFPEPPTVHTGSRDTPRSARGTLEDLAVEIDSAVADGERSVILPQVTFGIAVRMAVMSIIAGSQGPRT